MRDWLEAIGLFGIFLLASAAIGGWADLITMPASLDWAALWPVALVALFIPALGEELVFRVWLVGSHRRSACFEAASQHLSMRSQSESNPDASSPDLLGGSRDHPEPRQAGPGDDAFLGRLARPSAALALFVLWHPVQVWLDLPMAQPVFLEPAFLFLAGLLGLACTISWQRSGSIWPPVVMHWLVVVGWKALAG
tara:strand:- start:456 stop:1040 length:585 start_codon:yes stop_codon:yes gene_type:complete